MKSPRMQQTSHEQIAQFGERHTWQRAAVIEILREIENFASAKSIHEKLQDSGKKVGLTTVYRTLQGLHDAKIVDAIVMTSGETHYRVCIQHEHHHHLVCTSCGKTIELDGGPVENWAEEQASKYGFIVETHTAEVFGTCHNCGLSCANPK